MPVPLTRYVLVALLGLAAVLLVVLLVLPFIFSFAGERDDANYYLTAASTLDRGPVVQEILLNDRHGLRGEVVEGDRVGFTVAAARVPGQETYTVVGAWSPTNSCLLTLGADRLVDCQGDAWTYAGSPIDPDHPPLQRFPTEVRQGAVVVDFTRSSPP